MGLNVVQKIIKQHLISGKMVTEEEIAVKIDQTLTQDATGTMAYLQFEALGIPRVKTEVSVSYVDHNTLQEGFENADDHRYLQTVAAKYGILYSRAGNGICHQVHLERFAAPGKTLLGADSHTPTAGGIGSLAMGAGGLDVAVAMGGGPFYLTFPSVIKINLHGKLRPFVSAKDIILKILQELTTKGNVGSVVEYAGEGLQFLTVPQRATITNMGAELGVTTSIFPSDKMTRQFLIAQKRSKDWVEVVADEDAAYDRIMKIDLGRLVPMVACPHSPDQVKEIKELSGKPVNQVLIGSCTNASFRDMMTVASLLKGKKVHPDVSLGVACGSRQVFEMISQNGALTSMIQSGARILESTCGFCIGNGQSPQTNAVSIRTSNRNFEGRSGTKSAQVYLTSPESAVAAALKGEFADPSKYFAKQKVPRLREPRQFWVNDNMILFPSKKTEAIQILRGPNIGEPPANVALDENIQAVIAVKVGDKITTDHIMPAGTRLKYRSNIGKYSSFVFEGIHPKFPENCLANKKKGIGNVIVAGLSYGQGSSREHAAMCPMYLGVKMVLAKSIERIHRANLINFGIIPLLFKNPADYDLLAEGNMLEAENIRKTIKAGDTVVLKEGVNHREISAWLDLTQREREMILAGGLLNYTKSESV